MSARVQRSSPVEGSEVFHRFGVVVAQDQDLERSIANVTDSIHAKADETIRDAQGLADEMDRAAAAAERFMGSAKPVASLSGARAVRSLSALRPLEEMVERVEPRFQRLVEGEHGALFKVKTRETVETFFAWIRERRAELRVRARAFREEYRTAIREDAEQLGKIAEIWAPSLGDHLAAK